MTGRGKRMNEQRIKEILNMEPDHRYVEIHGWIRTVRTSKNVTFLEVNDGSCLKNLQVVLDHQRKELADLVPSLRTGASVSVQGDIAPSLGKNQKLELNATAVALIGPSPEDYPLQKKRHSFEFLREIAHLRPRTNTFGAVARVRNAVCYGIHSFFQERGFIYVHTPIISSNDCEGAGETFQVTTLPLKDIPVKENGEVDFTKDFFGKKASLTVSGQLEGEVYALALTNVYTFGPTFRAENSNTSRHLAEFWMVEPEMAFCDIHGNMDLAEEFLKHIISYVLDHCTEDMNFFDTWVEKGVTASLHHVLDADFARITYDEAVDHLEKADRSFEFKPFWGADLQSEHEKYLTEEVFRKPVIVTGYPKEIKAFYMKQNDDGRTVAAMDILVPRLGEIIGGSERESDRTKLETRIKEMGLPKEDYWWYLDLRSYGTVPHAGFGLGLERFIQYITGMQNIRDVIPFPRAVNTAEF